MPGLGVGEAQKNFKGIWKGSPNTKNFMIGRTGDGKGMFQHDAKVWGPRKGTEGALKLRIIFYIFKGL